MDDEQHEPVLIYAAWGQHLDERQRFLHVMQEMTWWLERRTEALNKATDLLLQRLEDGAVPSAAGRRLALRCGAERGGGEDPVSQEV